MPISCAREFNVLKRRDIGKKAVPGLSPSV